MRRLLRLGFILGLLLLAGVVAFYFSLGAAARKAVEVGGRETLGVEASLGDLPIALSPSRAELGLQDLAIANPPGFEAKSFLDIGEAKVSLDLPSLASDVIRVPEVRLAGLELRLAQRGSESNLLWFAERLRPQESDSSEAEPGTPPVSPEGEGGGKLLAVDTVWISGVKVGLDLEDVPYGEGSYTLELPALTLDLTEAEPGDTGSLMRVILVQLLDEAVDALGAELPPGVGEAFLSGGGWSGALDAAREAGERALEERVQEEVEKALQGLPQELSNPLKGLTGRKDG